MTEKKKVCMLCGKPSEESICESCKEKQVKVGSEVEKDRIVRKHIDK